MTTAHTDAEAPRRGAPVAGPSWDPLVRLTHWGVAAAVLLNGLITEGGEALHIWIGWAAAAFLALRLIWGFLGPEEARFSAFVPSVSAARAHFAELMSGRASPRRSHTPLGAFMVFALWATLAVTAGTGIAMKGAPPFEASRAVAAAGMVARADEDGDEHAAEHGGERGEGEEENEMLEEVHEASANLLLIFAALHVGGVVLESRLSRRNLARDMVTGGSGR